MSSFSSSYENMVVIEDFPTPSLMSAYPEDLNAVETNDLILKYGSTTILNRASVRIPYGSIYSLLGPSGCGKTSLIRCILGLVKPTLGQVKVFGCQPGGPLVKGVENVVRIPGPDVGYMPQDISLYFDMSTTEMLFYFGSLCNMPKNLIEERASFLLDFLNLPTSDLLVASLSGGQKRRLSLACALIHKPPLLILDEPTVGVDPILRKNIWRHLVEMSSSAQLTILITTHYIEEAKDSHVIGLMRKGYILAESNPQELMARHNCTTLERVFLKLCQAQRGDQVYSSVEPTFIQKIKVEKPQKNIKTKFIERHNPKRSYNYEPDFWRPICSMIKKNYVSLSRNLAYILFQLFLPALEVILFCVCIGGKLHNIPVSLYNGDNGSDFTQTFLKSFDPDMFHFTSYRSEFSAMMAVENGRASTAMLIPRNFSVALMERLNSTHGLDEDSLHQSTIQLHPDYANKIMAETVWQKAVDNFIKVGKKYLSTLGASPEMLDLPVNLSTPIYGHFDATFTEFMTPGVVLSIGFLAAVPLTALAVVSEHNSGMWERTMVTGTSTVQFLLALLISQIFIMLLQTGIVLSCVFFIFQTPYHGHFILITMLAAFQGFCGMCFGLLVSSVSQNETFATMLALGSFYPNLMLSGTVWPLEGMENGVRYFSYILPQTWAIEAMRSVIERGWGIDRVEVQLGLIVTSLWILIFLSVAALVLKYRK